MAYAVGGISGGHFNPAVSFGLWAGGRFAASDLVPYIVVQVLGATAVRRSSIWSPSGAPASTSVPASPPTASASIPPATTRWRRR